MCWDSDEVVGSGEGGAGGSYRAPPKKGVYNLKQHEKGLKSKLHCKK